MLQVLMQEVHWLPQCFPLQEPMQEVHWLVQPSLHPVTQAPEHVLQPDSPPEEIWGWSISQEVNSEGSAMAATVGSRIWALRLKKFLLEMISLSFFFMMSVLFEIQSEFYKESVDCDRFGAVGGEAAAEAEVAVAHARTEMAEEVGTHPVLVHDGHQRAQRAVEEYCYFLVDGIFRTQVKVRVCREPHTLACIIMSEHDDVGADTEFGILVECDALVGAQVRAAAVELTAVYGGGCAVACVDVARVDRCPGEVAELCPCGHRCDQRQHEDCGKAPDL